MPHVISQWEAMAWRRDAPDRRRPSRMSLDLRGKSTPSTPRETLGGSRSCDTSPSQQSLLTPLSVFSSTFDSRSSPSSSISSPGYFAPVFELEDTSPVRRRTCQQLTADDSLKITVFSPEIAAMDLPSPARTPRGRVESAALNAKVADRFARLEEEIDFLTTQLAAKNSELLAKDKALTATLRVADERREAINSLTDQLEHCRQFHIAPPTPPKESITRPRPFTAGTLSSAYSRSNTNLSSAAHISAPVLGTFRKLGEATDFPCAATALISLAEAQQLQQQQQRRRDSGARKRQQRMLYSSPSLPAISDSLAGAVRARHRYATNSAPEMAEKKKGGFLGVFGKRKD